MSCHILKYCQNLSKLNQNANWIHHGITTKIQVTEIMKEMAKIVDDQNKGDSKYVKMSDDYVIQDFVRNIRYLKIHPTVFLLIN